MSKKKTRGKKKSDKGAMHFKIGHPNNGNDSTFVMSHQVKNGTTEYHFSQDTKNVRNTRAMWSEQIGLDYLQKLFAATIEGLDLQFAVIWRIEGKEQLYKWNVHLRQWQAPPQYEAFQIQLREAQKKAWIEQQRQNQEAAAYKLWLPLKPMYKAEGDIKAYTATMDISAIDGQPFEQFRLLVAKYADKCNYSGRVYDHKTDKFIARIDLNTQAVKFL